jgi:hypothetical protein
MLRHMIIQRKFVYWGRFRTVSLTESPTSANTTHCSARESEINGKPYSQTEKQNISVLHHWRKLHIVFNTENRLLCPSCPTGEGD